MMYLFFSSCHFEVTLESSACPSVTGQCRSLKQLSGTDGKDPAVVVPCGLYIAPVF